MYVNYTVSGDTVDTTQFTPNIGFDAEPTVLDSAGAHVLLFVSSTPGVSPHKWGFDTEAHKQDAYDNIMDAIAAGDITSASVASDGVLTETPSS